VNSAYAVAAGRPLPDAGEVLFGPAVSLSAYVFLAAVSVLKPWGRTRCGLRRPAGAHAPARRPAGAGQ
jgi:hypothetical protein